MLRQIRYFLSVVKNNSFSEAAEECHISQSAVSQQIKLLEEELSVKLLERKNRKFTLTPAGEYFYKKSLVLVSDFDRICTETVKAAKGGKTVLKIACLSSYSGSEFNSALEKFMLKYKNVDIELKYGTHEEIYEMLLCDKADIILNDQRRKFSDEFVNLVLRTEEAFVALSSDSCLSKLSQISAEDLKNTDCIVVSSLPQRETEGEYYKKVFGIQSNIVYADDIRQAAVLISGGRGFTVLDGSGENMNLKNSAVKIPFFNSVSRAEKTYCAFWKKENSGYFTEEFADMLKESFNSK